MFNLIPLPYKIGAALLLFAGVAGFGYLQGAESVQDKWDAQKAADAAALATIKAKQRIVSEKADEAVHKALTETRIIYKTINREVPVYVTQKADAACGVTRGFVRLHDAAVQAIIPAPADNLNDEPANIAISTVADTITGNYGSCNEIRRQLIELQEWIKKQEAIGNG